uniref:Transmembrane protein n=1 Tax=Medicago truncatula TaxID=3880 RepID=I3S621_MEDTR|nr:unknown [Medicago truncatula]
MTPDTNTLSYWLNWRFFICAIFLLLTMGLGSFLIWKYEEFNKSRNERVEEGRRETVGLLYEDEAWNTCVKGIHPNWLLSYRISSFFVLLGLLTANVVVDGGGIFYFYTQWTFTLVTIYFALASCFSFYRSCFNHNEFEGNTLDRERGTYVAPTLDGISDIPVLSKSSYSNRESLNRNTAGVWGYIIQILFQTCAGAAMLTDLVFWLVIYPFMTSKDFRLDIFTVGMHSVNAVLPPW